MACRSGRRQHRMAGWKWTMVTKLQLLAVLLGEVAALASAMSVGDNSVGYAKQGFGFRRMPYKSLSLNKQQQHQQQQQRRLKQTGNEIIPAVGSNDISDEPTCEELRAMWRYYKRQSRAELTNEIPQFGKNPFFEILPAPPRNPVFSSFGMGPKGRAKNKMRPQNHLYGRVIQKPSKSRERGGGRNRNLSPFETVREMMKNPNLGEINSNVETSRQNSGGGEEAQAAAAMAAAAAVVTTTTTTTPPSVIVHYSPPPRPAKESSFQKLREIISNERMREKGATLASSSSSQDNREFGKIILSPPRGQDGRRINKPLERMTPFEKIRFGHADDLLDEGIRRNLDVMKRRTLPLSVLKTQWKQQQQQRQPLQKRRFLSNPMLFLTPSSSSGGGGDRSTIFRSSNYFEKRAEENNNNNNIIAQTNDKQQLDSRFENENVPTQLHDDNPTTLLANNDNNNNNIIINNGDFTDSIIDEVPSSPSASSSTSAAAAALSNYASNVRQMVEMPTCVEVEHQTCNQTVDCSCIGFALYRCYLNQCQILPLAYSVQEELPSTDEELSSASSDNSQPDIWHSEPLPSEKLGIWEDPIMVGVDNSAAARLSTIRARKSIQNEGKANNSNARLIDTTYLVLQGQNLYT